MAVGGEVERGIFKVLSKFLRDTGSGAVHLGERAVAKVRYAARPYTTPIIQRIAKADPVDVATGEVLLTQTDVELPGTLPLVLSRTHVSSYRTGAWFGPSWASTLDQRLELAGSQLRFLSADGMDLAFPIPVGGGAVVPFAGPRLSLCRAGGGFTLTDPTGDTSLRFDGGPDTFRLTSISDRNGNRLDVIYDPEDTITEIRHNGGYTVAVESDGGRITAFRMRDATLVGYGYDEAGNLASVIDHSGRPLRFSYDADGRMTEWRDRNGYWYRYAYDGSGRCVRTEGKDGFLSASFTYGTRVTTMTNSLGAEHRFEFNDRGRVAREVDPLGNTTRRTWDDRDRLVAQTDPLGHTARYFYDDEDNVTVIERPDGRRTRMKYAGPNRPVRVTCPDGAIWRHRYDERGNLTATTNPLGATTRYTYGDHGGLRSVTDPVGRTTRIHTNRAGLPVDVVDPAGSTTRYVWDAFGRLIAVRGPAGGPPTRLGWTAEGRLAWRMSPDGVLDRYRYDGEGNLLEHTDGAGRATHYSYTGFDLISERVDPDGTRWEFRHDTELRPVTVRDPRGTEWRYEYDHAGRLIAETDVNGRRLTYGYDAAGRLVMRRNGNGQALRLVRDVLGNVVEERAADRTVATYAYDTAGRMTRARNGDAEVTFVRDMLGQVTAENCDGRAVSSVFDAAGRRVRRTTPAGVRAAWRYDGRGRPTALLVAEESVTLHYDRHGRETTRDLPGGVVVDQRWDPAHRLTAQTIRGAAGVLRHRDLTYRPDGILATIDEHPGGLTRLSADAAGRITGVDAHGERESYEYDGAGNITAARRTGAPRRGDGPREYAATLLRRAGELSYQHDRHGRQVARSSATSPGAWHYTWDINDRLIVVRAPNGDRWRYRYDALGRRVAKQRLDRDGSPVEWTDFTWDDQVLAEECSRNGTVTWEYLPGTFRPIAQIERSRRLTAIVTDALGTPRDLIDDQGNLSDARHSLGGPKTPLRYPGQYFDEESGLHYNHHRYYDPATARYLTADPLGLGGGPNPHAYVDNPYHLADPLGLVPCLPTRPDGNLVFRGHGGYFEPHGTTIVPEGTEVAFYSKHGESTRSLKKPSDELFYIEDGKRYQNMAAITTRTGLPTYYTHPGEEIPNYTLYPPGNLTVIGKAKVVTWPTNLSDLLEPNMGTVHWTACRNIIPSDPMKYYAQTFTHRLVVRASAAAAVGATGYSVYKLNQLRDLKSQYHQLGQTITTHLTENQFNQKMREETNIQNKIDNWSLF